MSIEVKDHLKIITVKVIKAEYVKDADSILILGECEHGVLRYPVSSSLFDFGNLNKEEEMIKTANLMVGKKINIAFDPELENKIKDKYPLKYDRR